MMIERRVVQPLTDWIGLHEQVLKTIGKRERKLIDYDRHRESLKKAKEQPASYDEKKIMKVLQL